MRRTSKLSTSQEIPLKKRNPSSTRTRRWTWTLNNPTRTEMIGLTKLSSDDGVRSMIVGVEKGSRKGTEHLQGYSELSTPLSLGQFKTLMKCPRIHAEPSIGSGQQNKDYCLKDHQPLLIFGVPCGDARKALKTLTGGSSDFSLRALDLQKKIKNGTTVQDLWNQDFDFMLRYHVGVNQYLRLQRPNRVAAPRVELLLGPPGTGKTRYVHDFAYIFYNNADPGTWDPDLWTWGGSGPWFDGYAGHRVALFDDFRGSIPLESFLKALDRYDNQQPVKGGFVWFYPERIFITSNDHPCTWYPDASESSLAALLRRMTIYKVFDNVEFNPLETLK